jgi:hypothetical protein
VKSLQRQPLGDWDQNIRKVFPLQRTDLYGVATALHKGNGSSFTRYMGRETARHLACARPGEKRRAAEMPMPERSVEDPSGKAFVRSSGLTAELASDKGSPNNGCELENKKPPTRCAEAPDKLTRMKVIAGLPRSFPRQSDEGEILQVGQPGNGPSDIPVTPPPVMTSNGQAEISPVSRCSRAFATAGWWKVSWIK